MHSTLIGCTCSENKIPFFGLLLLETNKLVHKTNNTSVLRKLDWTRKRTKPSDPVKEFKTSSNFLLSPTSRTTIIVKSSNNRLKSFEQIKEVGYITVSPQNK